MAQLAQKLKNNLPHWPRRRYHIFAGANPWQEYRLAFESWRRREPPEGEEEIRAYEAEFGRMVGMDQAISFGAGRMAFFAILSALGIGAGDEVILPAYTCAVVPNAVIYRDARPVYVDIEPRTFNIDASRVEAAITPRTRALYAQHTFGAPCDLAALKDIGRRRGMVVIEDCGHALGGSLNGKPLGSFGDVAYFTTDHSKTMGTYLGGMAATNDPALGRRLRELQEQTPFLPPELHRRLLQSFLLEMPLLQPSVYWLGRSVHSLLSRLGWLFSFRDELLSARPTAYPFPNRLSALQARIGRSQLRLLKANLAHRRQLAGFLEDKIGWYQMSPDKFRECSWLRYSFLVRDREALERRFRRRFDLGIWFTSVAHGRTAEFMAIGYREGSCPGAEAVARHIANFPTHPLIPLWVLEEQMALHGDWLRSQLLPPDELNPSSTVNNAK